MKSNIVNQFNLPNYVKGKSFADASKAIESKFKGRNDKASLDTKKELISRLRQAQEHLKMQTEVAQQAEQNQAFLGALFGNKSTVTPDVATPGINPEAEGIGAEDITGGINDLLQAGQDIFGKPNVDTSGFSRGSSDGGAAGAIDGGINAIKGFATGDIIGGVGGVVKGIGSLIGGSKEKKAVNEANHRNTQMQSNNLRPYNNGGLVSNPKKDKAIHLPEDSDPNKNIELLDKYAKQKKLDLTQVDGFLDQRESDRDWTNKKKEYLNTQMKEWRSGKTGHSPNDKFTMVSPEYQAALKEIKDNWYKENPREINEVVQDYALNGPAGIGQGLNLNKNKIFENLPLKNNEGLAITENKYGGKVNQYNKGGEIDYDAIKSALAFKPSDIDASVNGATEIFPDNKKTGVGKFIDGAADIINKHGANALQYAPVVGELFNKISKPTTERGTRLTGRARLDRADEATTQNLINDNNVFEGVKTAAAGNLGALMAGNLAANLGKTKAKSAAYASDRAFNADQLEKETSLDRQADLANMAADDRFLERKAQDEGAYNTAKDAKRASIINSLGNIGREESNKKLVKEMFGYTWNGQYYVDKNGKKVDQSEVAKSIQNLNRGKTAMFGGYLKK